MMSSLAALKLVATSLMAQSKPVIKVNVPFDFVAGAKTLPAGEYQVQTEWPSVALMQRKDSKSNVNLAVHFAPTRRMSGVAVLRFNRYGNRYFLSEIWTGSDLAQELPKSRAEREQIAATGSSHAVVALTAER